MVAVLSMLLGRRAPLRRDVHRIRELRRLPILLAACARG